MRNGAGPMQRTPLEAAHKDPSTPASDHPNPVGAQRHEEIEGSIAICKPTSIDRTLHRYNFRLPHT